MTEKRFIFYNPHASVHFGSELFYVITKRNSSEKQKYLLKYALKKNKKVYVYLDRNSFILKHLDKILGKFAYILEFYLWCIFNKYNPFKFKTILKPKNLTKNDQLFLFVFPFLENMYDEKVKIILEMNIMKIIHMTHYFIGIEKISQNLKTAKNYYLVEQNNLIKNSSFFKKYFPYVNEKKFITLQFTYKERFKNMKKYEKRTQYSIATGTLFIPKDDELIAFKPIIEYFKVLNLHPMRKELYENKEYFKELIDIYIAHYYDNQSKKIVKNDNIFIKIYKALYYSFFVKQKSYFKFNIVEKFNEYKLFIVPEEIIGLPGISFVEGMACGCVFVGIEDKMYTSIGMKPGIHYISYNGTKEDLKKVLEDYKKKPEILSKISQNGYKFAKENFNPEKVSKKFFKKLKNL